MTGKPDGLFDRRVVQRNLKHGRLSRKEFDQYLASLPDASAKAVPMFFDRVLDANREPDELDAELADADEDEE
jgi:hypothetical protein